MLSRETKKWKAQGAFDKRAADEDPKEGKDGVDAAVPAEVDGMTSEEQGVGTSDAIEPATSAPPSPVKADERGSLKAKGLLQDLPMSDPTGQSPSIIACILCR